MYKKFSAFFVTVVLLAAVVVAVFHAQLIKDTVLYYQYQPDETVASFVEQTGMSDYGRLLYYASQPSLESADTFNQQCDKKDSAAAVLGCYDGQRIYIYNITDPRLDGIRPTTAAHEMLHAAYKRLSNTDKQVVDALLEDEYLKLKDDTELSERMAFYAEAQPGDRDNELHSIVGTEISDISPELEAHYSQYFSDRTKVVAQHQRYHSVFEELRTHADKLTDQINQIEQDLQGKRASYDALAVGLQKGIADFNARANQGNFNSQSEFSNERQSLITRSSSLEILRTEINNDINDYNRLVSELNSIVVETNALNRSIDSSLEPAPSL